MTLHSRYTRICALLMTFILVAAIPVRAFGAPVDDKRAQALKVKAQVEDLDAEVEIATEAYNEANASYRAVTAKVTANEKKLGELTAHQKKLQKHLDTRVNSMYRSGPLGFLEILVGANTFEELATNWDLLQAMNEQDAEAVADLKVTRAEVSKTQAELKTNQAQAKKERDALASQKSAIEKRLADRKKLLNGLESEIAQLEREAEEAARRTYRPPVRDAGGDPGTQPKSGIVDIAKSKLGSRYVWAASGPNTFDCSGFTMWVYAQVGVSLPHSSRAQYNSGPRVSKANLKPGDLVFFGRSVIHHVGIYVGGGMYIHAPSTGDVVKISSLNRSDYVGACRP
ncbi:MAG: hypothetical protein D9V44_10895 [Actinobacteria bacterium]|nr:MAG: hypothetical protein D9V44_10895 [Actinomycetota bacterium]